MGHDLDRLTDPAACASPEAATPPSLAAPTAAGAQTARPVVTVTAADWPSFAYVPGRYLPSSVPGTVDLVVDGRPVTVGLHWDVGGTEQPYVADAPEELTIAECDEIDRVVALAWDAHGKEAA